MAPRHSNPDGTVATLQPSLSSSFRVTILFISSASANSTCKPLKRELECGCSDDSPDPEMGGVMDGQI
uniref:Uncharacterized protein n=1 Tax=Rhizophora mucronata TaxID=61149 RepID=A0A2P2NFT4_RHIMU